MDQQVRGSHGDAPGASDSSAPNQTSRAKPRARRPGISYDNLMSAWRGWSHCMASTYGTWLPGDPRGFRSRDHRRHVEGDYKSPPSEDFTRLHASARRSLKRPPVVLSREARQRAAGSIRTTLVDVHGIETLAIAVSATHFHLLARFPLGQAASPESEHRHGDLRMTDPVRYFVGIAKERSAKDLARDGLVEAGGVWGGRGKIVPVENRAHQLRVFNYICEHANEGAAVWTFRDSHA